MPADNAQKLPFANQLHQFGDNKSQDWAQRQPQRMPVTVTAVNGPLVTVSFDGNWAPFGLPTVTIAKAESQWAREPTQVGDKGFASVSDRYLGGQSGIGGGTADLYERGNLTNLVFQPLSNETWIAVPNVNQYTITGLAGAYIRTQDGTTYIDVQETQTIIHDANGNEIRMLAGKIFIKPGLGNILYLGGDGTIGSYDWVLTNSGPCTNYVKGRYA